MHYLTEFFWASNYHPQLDSGQIQWADPPQVQNFRFHAYCDLKGTCGIKEQENDKGRIQDCLLCFDGLVSLSTPPRSLKNST